MNVRQAQDHADGLRWERFLAQRQEATHCHRWGWKEVVEKSFRWPTFYLMAEEGDEIRGVLPLVWQKSRLFGSFLTSVPYLNAGGTLAVDEQARDALTGEAIELARRRKARYLELRYRTDPGLHLPTRCHKVAMVLPLPSDPEAMWAGLPHKVRTDIRKGMKANLEAEFAGEEFLDDFYAVFARNMRDLGTPVYGRQFFSTILRLFPEDAHICRVRCQGATIAVSFLIGYRETLEAVWSASRYDYLAMRPNMFLYWSILRFAAERGFRCFDFGRSTIGSGTHQFKKQWGAGEVPLHWAYWLPENASLPELNPENPRYRLAINLWRRLPVPVTKLLGPGLARRLP
ncbi:MAG TPA: FemAB family XrtA/PEP-CTERM system-associated protein [Candidatus Dormibacteraeota bacterium]|nr:FemAB family XrtA/PEP-CTERM system-associated protein [Candidatus Dormibacteraeota bacterium]